MKVLFVSDKDKKVLKSFNKLEIIHFPTIKTEPLDFSIDNVENYDVFIFTSQKAVKYFFKKVPPEKLKVKTFIAVGEKTEKKLRNYGFSNILIPEDNRAKGIVELILSNFESFKNKKILFPRAREGRREIIEQLSEKLDITPVDVYQTKTNYPENIETVKNMLLQNKIKVLAFTSPSSFKNFMKIFKGENTKLFENKIIATIGETTKEEIEKTNLKVSITPKKSSIEDLLKEISENI